MHFYNIMVIQSGFYSSSYAFFCNFCTFSHYSCTTFLQTAIDISTGIF